MITDICTGGGSSDGRRLQRWIKIPFGQNAEGRMVHISEVPSGRACGCVCAQCGTPLIAYKGQRRQEHFGHSADRECKGALETALHKFAKETLAANRMLILPPLVVEVGAIRRQIRDPSYFTYDSVKLEQSMPDMRPDVVIARGNRELLVEIAVTHPCEEQKLNRLRERRIAAIEIDLSQVPPFASPATHAREILEAAPRRWLFNKYICDHEKKIQQHMAEKETAKRARQNKEWAHVAKKLADILEHPRDHDDESALQSIRDADLEACVGFPIRGDECFAVSARAWQGAVIRRVILEPGGPWYDCPPRDIVEILLQSGYLKSGLDIDLLYPAAEMSRFLTETVPGYRPVLEVVEEYMMELARLRLLSKSRAGWSASTPKAYAARAKRDQIGEIHERRNILQREVDAIKSAGIRGNEIDFGLWMKRTAQGFDSTPEEIVTEGGSQFERLLESLRFLRQLTVEDTYPTAGNLLGLPLEEDLAARIRERDERNQSRRREREETEQAVTRKRSIETRDFLIRLREDALVGLGDEAGATWAANNMPTLVEGLVIQPEMKERLQECLEVALRLVRQAATNKAAAEQRAARYRAELRAAAARDAELLNPERLNAWLRTSRPNLDGARPEDFCVDRHSLTRCLSELPSRMARRGRRRLGK